MMAITHAAIAAAGTSLILGTANPLNLGLAVLGSQLPDLDTSTSLIGQILFPMKKQRLCFIKAQEQGISGSPEGVG